MADDAGPVFFYEREFYVFSNFSSFQVDIFGKRWQTSEHAYHSAKFIDTAIKELIANTRSAHEALKFAHAHKDLVRPDWDEIKVGVMEQICRAKLEQHEYIQRLLLRTGDREIIEDSHRDDFWGWGLEKNGQNELGKIWMRLRTELFEGRIKRLAA